jgi:hypothetical protein
MWATVIQQFPRYAILGALFAVVVIRFLHPDVPAAEVVVPHEQPDVHTDR